MQSEIIIIGDEILIGQVTDTNSSWIAGQLNLCGIKVSRITAIGDNQVQILNKLSEAENKSDLVIITGGLGPTRDDITKAALCRYFDSTLVINQGVLSIIEERCRKRNISMNELNISQALLPDNCVVLPNNCGTAPGMWFTRNNKVFVSLPGVPFEMKAIIESEVLPRLKSFFRKQEIFHKTILTFGIPESMLAINISGWETSLPENIKLAYLPSPGMVRLRLSITDEIGSEIKKLADEKINELSLIIPDAIIGFDNSTLEGVTGKLLTDKSSTLSIAESCTGGKIAHLITSVPGSSEYFLGSVTAYSNNAKIKLLNVRKESISAHGAVSKDVVEQMAAGVRELFGSDYSLATSGIAGPDGGTDEKPVGTTWIAIASAKQIISEMFLFADNRERNIHRASLTAINMLRKLILSDC